MLILLIILLLIESVILFKVWQRCQELRREVQKRIEIDRLLNVDPTDWNKLQSQHDHYTQQDPADGYVWPNEKAL